MKSREKKAPKEKKKYGFKWILAQTKGCRGILLLFSLFAAASSGANLLMAYILKLFMDIATGESGYELTTVAVWALLLTVATGLFFVGISLFKSLFYGKMEGRLRGRILNSVFSKQMSAVSVFHTGEVLTRLTADVAEICNCMPTVVQNIFVGVLTAAGATLALFMMSWKISLIVLFTIPLLMLVMSVFSPFMQRASKKDKENDEAHRKFMQEALSRIILVKSYFMHNKISGNSSDIYSKKIKSGVKVGLWEGYASFAGNLFGMSMFLVVLGFGSYYVAQGELTVGTLIAMVQLMNYIVNPIANLSTYVSKVNQSVASAGRIGEIHDIPVDGIEKIPEIQAAELKAEGVGFAYNENGDAVSDIDLSFKKGAVTGIVGKSGAGKSTLLKLIIGLYTPKSGEVKLLPEGGGNALKNGEILSQIAYVPPVDYLFSGTVKENICMADEAADMDFMRECAEKANVLEFIESLPKGFETVLGESGGTVSSGQAQRLAIARALYKKSPVIVFDEPTANLDAESIEKFQSTLKAVSAGKICIAVTHDKSTMNVCDYVYVLDAGRITEQGTPGEITAYREDEEKPSEALATTA